MHRGVTYTFIVTSEVIQVAAPDQNIVGSNVIPPADVADDPLVEDNAAALTELALKSSISSRQVEEDHRQLIEDLTSVEPSNSDEKGDKEGKNSQTAIEAPSDDDNSAASSATESAQTSDLNQLDILFDRTALTIPPIAELDLELDDELIKKLFPELAAAKNALDELNLLEGLTPAEFRKLSEDMERNGGQFVTQSGLLFTQNGNLAIIAGNGSAKLFNLDTEDGKQALEAMKKKLGIEQPFDPSR